MKLLLTTTLMLATMLNARGSGLRKPSWQAFENQTKDTPAVEIQRADRAGLTMAKSRSTPETGDDTKGKIQNRSYYFKDAGKDMPYTLYVPTSYDATRKTPLIIALHGLDSNPTQLINYPHFVESAEKYGFIVACPEGYSYKSWYGAQELVPDSVLAKHVPKQADGEEGGRLGAEDVMNVLGMMQEEFNVDSDRIYLMGHSMGGCGTYYLAYKHPEIFAALGTMAPANQFINDPATRTKVLQAIQHLPVVCLQGYFDEFVPVSVTRTWVDEMKQMGMECNYHQVMFADHFSITLYTSEVVEFFNTHSKGKE